MPALGLHRIVRLNRAVCQEVPMRTMLALQVFDAKHLADDALAPRLESHLRAIREV